MLTFISTQHYLMIRLDFPSNTNNAGQIYELRISPLQAGPGQIESVTGTRFDNRHDPLPGDQRRKPSAQGV
jgi:hypothetical protein